MRSVAGDAGREVVGEPLTGQSFDQLGKCRGGGGVQVSAAAHDHGEDLGEGGVFSEIGVDPQRRLHQRVGRHDHPGWSSSCG